MKRRDIRTNVREHFSWEIVPQFSWLAFHVADSLCASFNNQLNFSVFSRLKSVVLRANNLLYDSRVLIHLNLHLRFPHFCFGISRKMIGKLNEAVQRYIHIECERCLGKIFYSSRV